MMEDTCLSTENNEFQKRNLKNVAIKSYFIKRIVLKMHYLKKHPLKNII